MKFFVNGKYVGESTGDDLIDALKFFTACQNKPHETEVDRLMREAVADVNKNWDKAKEKWRGFKGQ